MRCLSRTASVSEDNHFPPGLQCRRERAAAQADRIVQSCEALCHPLLMLHKMGGNQIADGAAHDAQLNCCMTTGLRSAAISDAMSPNRSPSEAGTISQA